MRPTRAALAGYCRKRLLLTGTRSASSIFRQFSYLSGERRPRSRCVIPVPSRARRRALIWIKSGAAIGPSTRTGRDLSSSSGAATASRPLAGRAERCGCCSWAAFRSRSPGRGTTGARLRTGLVVGCTADGTRSHLERSWPPRRVRCGWLSSSCSTPSSDRPTSWTWDRTASRNATAGSISRYGRARRTPCCTYPCTPGWNRCCATVSPRARPSGLKAPPPARGPGPTPGTQPDRTALDHPQLLAELGRRGAPDEPAPGAPDVPRRNDQGRGPGQTGGAAPQRRDLRRTGIVRLAEAGATVPQIAALSGHSIDYCQRILGTYLPRRTEVALGGIETWERSAGVELKVVRLASERRRRA